MGYFVEFFGGRLGRSNIHIPIYLHGIRTDNLSVKPLGKLNTDRGFTDPCGATDDDDFGFFRSRIHNHIDIVLNDKI
jgi:hypothetical protein